MNEYTVECTVIICIALVIMTSIISYFAYKHKLNVLQVEQNKLIIEKADK